MAINVAITILCGVGLCASLFMLRKARRAARGQLAEFSVVQTPRARLYGGVSNALLGALYYPALAAVAWLAAPRTLALAALAAVVIAAGTSAILAYSLLYVTRRPCALCWSAHAINWLLVLLFTAHLRSAGLLW